MTKIKRDELEPLSLEEAYKQNFITVNDIRRIFVCGVNVAQAILRKCQDMAKTENPYYLGIRGKILPSDLRRYVECKSK